MTPMGSGSAQPPLRDGAPCQKFYVCHTDTRHDKMPVSIGFTLPQFQRGDAEPVL
jgi:hypothetical protein